MLIEGAGISLRAAEVAVVGLSAEILRFAQGDTLIFLVDKISNNKAIARNRRWSQGDR